MKKKPVKKWKPKNNDYYYLILTFGEVCHWLNCSSHIDKANYKAGNCFKTMEEAEAVAKKFRKILKEAKR